MAENKTQATNSSIASFFDAIEDEQRRQDCITVATLMEEATGEQAKIWGPAIVGFGQYHYKYASGREGNFMIVGFSPRKQNLTLYIMGGFSNYDVLLSKLGKYKTGKSCLYLKSLKDVDLAVLKQLITESVQYMRIKNHIEG
jgi:hypothetical protein